MAEQDTEPGGAQAIAQRLEALFAMHRSPDGRPFTDDEIAARAVAAGFDISRAYVQQLRRGRRTNPTVRALQGVAAAFGVPLSYFFADQVGDRASEEQALALLVGDEALRDIALRSSHLTPEGVRAISGLLKNLEQLPGLARYPRETPEGGESAH